MSLHSIFSIIIFLLMLTFSSSVLAWQTPEKVWVNHSMPPTYWMKTGGILQQSGCSIQRYDLFRAGGAPQNSFRMAVVCPKKEKFCVEVLPDNQLVGALPLDCSRAVPDSAVNISISSFLYTSGDKK